MSSDVLPAESPISVRSPGFDGLSTNVYASFRNKTNLICFESRNTDCKPRLKPRVLRLENLDGQRPKRRQSHGGHVSGGIARSRREMEFRNRADQILGTAISTTPHLALFLFN